MAGSLPLDGAGPMGIIYDREQELYAAVPALGDNGPISTERQTANYMSGKKAYAFFDSEEDARAWRTQHTTPEAVSARVDSSDPRCSWQEELRPNRLPGTRPWPPASAYRLTSTGTTAMSWTTKMQPAPSRDMTV